MSYANWKHYATAVVFMMILDGLWIGLYFGGQYQIMLKQIQKGDPMEARAQFFPIAYFAMIIGLCGITIPSIDPNNLWPTILRYGTFLGFAIYGTYAFTCASIFKNFDPWIAVQDTVWGTFLYTILPYLAFTFFKTETQAGRQLND